MSSTTWSFYNKSTGLFTRGRFIAPSHADITGCIPEGCAALAGEYDPLSQRVDLSTGQVVEYRPDPPSADHEWNAEMKRWTLPPAIAAKAWRRREILDQLGALEQQKLRPLGELASDTTSDEVRAEARRRLSEIEMQLEGLRQELRAIGKPAG